MARLPLALAGIVVTGALVLTPAWSPAAAPEPASDPTPLLTARLGWWQLDRAAQRLAAHAAIELYAAAFVPGVLLAVLYVLTVLIVAWVWPSAVPRIPGLGFTERIKAARGMWKLGILFFFAVFGIYLGWFSPTEAAAISAFVAIVIGFATRAMGWRQLGDALLETAFTTAAIFFIVVGAFIFSRFIVLTRAPVELAELVKNSGMSWIWVLFAITALYLILGTFLDEVSMILISVPVTLPLIAQLGYDGIWFGIFVTVMCTIGLISPPTGMTVFVIQAQHPDIPVERIYLGTLPFLLAAVMLAARNASQLLGGTYVRTLGRE